MLCKVAGYKGWPIVRCLALLKFNNSLKYSNSLNRG